MARVFVARKSCGCIVAAFPIQMDKSIKAELMKQFTKAGYDLEQAGELDVRCQFNLTCDHGKPPLLKIMDEAQETPTSIWDPAPLRDEMAAADAPVTEAQAEEAQEPTQEEINNDGGVEMADVNALAEEAEEETATEEAAEIEDA